MAAIATTESICSGHDGFPPRQAVSGESGFRVNGIPVLVDGSPFNTHAKPKSPPHGGVAVGTKSSFKINGNTVALVGDPVSCGSTIVTGDDGFNVS